MLQCSDSFDKLSNFLAAVSIKQMAAAAAACLRTMKKKKKQKLFPIAKCDFDETPRTSTEG